MVIQRGEVWWASLPEPVGAMPGYRRPVVIISADAFNRSRIKTVLVIVLTSNLRLASAPGNVLLSAKATGLNKDSVANVSQLLTADKGLLTEKIGTLSARQMRKLEAGLRKVMAL